MQSAAVAAVRPLFVGVPELVGSGTFCVCALRPAKRALEDVQKVLTAHLAPAGRLVIAGDLPIS
jgi:hypothetical protein